MPQHLFLNTLASLGPEQPRQGVLTRPPPFLPQATPWLPPQNAALVAGTNGKGSTSFYLAELLRQAGKKPMVFLSPHLVCPSERFLFQGKPLGLQLLDEATAQLLAAAKKKPFASFFEFLTALAPVATHLAGADTMILEAGLGGQHDATNHLPHHFNLLTGVARDHAEVLGPSQSQRLTDKLGIVGRSQPVYTGPLSPALKKLAGEVITRQGDHWRAQIPRFFSSSGLVRNLPPPWRLSPFEQGWEIGHGPFHLAFFHRYPPLVQAAALALLAAVDMSGGALPHKLHLRHHLPGRCQFQTLPGKPFPLIQDVAHNPQAAAALGYFVRQLFPKEKILLLFALLRRKEAPATIRALHQHLQPQRVLCPGDWLMNTTQGPWHEPAHLARLFQQRGHGAQVLHGFEELATQAQHHNGPVVLVGGFQWLGAWRRQQGEKTARPWRDNSPAPAER